MTNHNLGSRKIIKDVVIVGIVVLIIWICLTVIFGTANPFYVVASGSMLPTLEVNDVIVIESNTAFEDIKKSDIIVFFSPAKYEKFLNGEPGGEERVIVHRVDLIMEDEPKIVRTRGDNNPSSIQGAGSGLFAAKGFYKNDILVLYISPKFFIKECGCETALNYLGTHMHQTR